MNHLKERKRRLETFEDTLLTCERREELIKSIEHSIQYTTLWENPVKDIIVGAGRFEDACEVCVIEGTTLEETKRLCEMFPKLRVGVLNVAFPACVGGSVIRGGKGQEESLCRCTTLYPCLNTDSLRTGFYEKNCMCEGGMYSDRCIYIPDVCGIRVDLEKEDWLAEPKRYFFDVICCAAPGRSNTEVMERRIEAVCRVAIQKEIDVLVLGIFGHETVEHNMELMIESYKKALQKYSYFFRAVHFAVWQTPFQRSNYEIF